MEYVEGSDLAGLLRVAYKRGNRVPTDIALRIVLDALAGLEAAHTLKDADGASYDLVHRDISPQNILVGVDGVARVLDFGIARIRTGTTDSGAIKGKLPYVAPELFRGAAPSRQSDVYAAGVVLWEALTAQPLFRAESDGQLIGRILEADIRLPSRVCPSVDPRLDPVVMKAMHPDPTRRYDSASAFAEALHETHVDVASKTAVGDLVRRKHGRALEKRRARLRKAMATVSRQEPSSVSEHTTEPGRPRPRRRSAGRVALAAGFVGLLAAAGWFLHARMETRTVRDPGTPAVGATTGAGVRPPPPGGEAAPPEAIDTGTPNRSEQEREPEELAPQAEKTVRPPSRERTRKKRRGGETKEWWPDGL